MSRPAHAQQNNGLRRWSIRWSSLLVSVIALAGLMLVLYPSTAAWWNQWNQSRIIASSNVAPQDAWKEQKEVELARAREYNNLLDSGALLEAGERLPLPAGSYDSGLDYWDLLNVNDEGMMGRIRVPSVDIDLPLYHGTSDEVLLKGAGHLQGTSLPVGGAGTHTVVTAHRGLAQATMFTNLDKVDVGDTFTLETMGEVLTYRIIEKQVVDPSDRKTVLPRSGMDLATLVTCTPLGVNSHRILLTGSRIMPTPIEDLERVGLPPEVPGFPWWALWMTMGFSAAGVYIWRSGYEKVPSKRNQDEISVN